MRPQGSPALLRFEKFGWKFGCEEVLYAALQPLCCSVALHLGAFSNPAVLVAGFGATFVGQQ
jgi:hypothetical protein